MLALTLAGLRALLLLCPRGLRVSLPGAAQGLCPRGALLGLLQSSLPLLLLQGGDGLRAGGTTGVPLLPARASRLLPWDRALWSDVPPLPRGAAAFITAIHSYSMRAASRFGLLLLSLLLFGGRRAGPMLPTEGGMVMRGVGPIGQGGGWELGGCAGGEAEGWCVRAGQGESRGQPGPATGPGLGSGRGEGEASRLHAAVTSAHPPRGAALQLST